MAHMEDGRKESFFGSDRMELLAFVLGEYGILEHCFTV